MQTSQNHGHFQNWRLACAGDVRPFSSWIEFFVSLGYLLSCLPDSKNRRYVVGLSVPSRCYVAAFVLAGFWIGRALSNKAASARAHFQSLQSLPNMAGATYARVHADTKQWTLYKGYLLKPKSHDFVRFCYGPNDLCWSVCEEDSLFITPTGTISAPHTQNRKPTELNIGADYWHGVGLSSQAIAMFAANRRRSMLVVGVLGQVQKEFEEIALLPSRTSEASMSVADICGIKMPNRLAGFLTDIMSSLDKSPIAGEPDWTVYDARLGFIRQRRRLNQSNWVVIADRFQDQQHTETVQALNSIYLESLNRANISQLLPRPPRGVGITAFEMDK